MSNYKLQSIGKTAALELAKSGWWKDKPARQIAKFQLFTAELSMPFGIFHQALEHSLGRPVFTHELGSSNYDNIVMEFLGEKDAPSIQEIIDLLPEEKRIIVEAH